MVTFPRTVLMSACFCFFLVGCTSSNPSPPSKRAARDANDTSPLIAEYKQIRTLLDAGQYVVAEPLVRRHYEKCLAASATEPEALARAHAALAHLCNESGRPDEAEQNYRAALVIREKINPENPYLVGTLLNLSSLLVDRGDPEEAEALLTKAARLADSPNLPSELQIQALSALARFLTDRKRYEEAEPTWRRIAKITESLRAKNDPRHSEVLNNIAFVVEGQGRLADAIKGYQEALAVCATDMGTEGQEWLRIDMNLFSCRRKATRQIRALTPTEAQQLIETWSGSLELSGITELTPHTAQVLAEHDGELILDHITSLPPEVAAAIAQHKHQLNLDGLVVLSEAAAKALAAHRTTLNAGNDSAITQEMLARLGGVDLSLNGLAVIPDDVADALSTHRGSLAMKGLRTITRRSADSLVKHDGILDLRGLKDCSDDTKAILRANERIVLPDHNSSTETTK